MKPREGYIFTPNDCPNAPHPPEWMHSEKCGLCGINVKAWRFGYVWVPRILGGVLVAAVLTVAWIAVGGH